MTPGGGLLTIIHRLGTALLAFLVVALCPATGAAAEGGTLLDAASAGDAATVRSLLAAGHAVDRPGPDGATPLLWAVYSGDPATVDALIHGGADVSATNALGVSPVYLAASNGDAAILTRLLEAGADANAVDTTGDTVLMAAVRAESPEAVGLLLDRGAQVDISDPELAHTALMGAVRMGHPEIIRMLLAAGASVEAATRIGPTPDVRPPGAGGGSHGVGIVRSGVPPQGERLPTPGGMTPLLFAARDGHLEAAKLLLEAGADLNRPDPNGLTPLLMAITNNQLPVAAWLLAEGADPNRRDWYGRAPLWAAVEIRNLDLRSGTTDNGVDRDAALQLIEALIDRGADVNARVQEFPPQRRYMLPLGSLEWVDFTGQTPFIRAAQSGDVTLMRLLLANGADPRITTFHGTSALMAAAGVNWVIGQTYSESPEVWVDAVRLCLDLGLDVNAVNDMGLAAVHGAANRGSDDVVALLAAHGARLDVADQEGRTPIAWAEGVFLATNSPMAKPSTIALLQQLLGSAPAQEIGSVRP